jgi:hypothetical protein
VHRALQSRETSPPGSERLDSWKEIAAYLGRQVRTLHLWEKAEKLPVHRHIHSKRGTVYAFKSELDAWKQARTLLYANRNKGVQGRAGTAAKEMVGVLPFENLSGDASQEYLGDGLTEEVISQLGRIRPERLRVIARTSSMHYKNSDKGIAVTAKATRELPSRSPLPNMISLTSFLRLAKTLLGFESKRWSNTGPFPRGTLERSISFKHSLMFSNVCYVAVLAGSRIPLTTPQ